MKGLIELMKEQGMVIKIATDSPKKDKHTPINPNQSIIDQYGVDAVIKYLLKNNKAALYQLLKSGDVYGRCVENIMEEKTGSNKIKKNNQNTIGYDLISSITGLKEESKSTSTITKANLLQISGLLEKRKGNGNEGCDVMIITDLCNFRQFRIPHDDFFESGKFKFYYATNAAGVQTDMYFYWDAYYGTKGNRQQSNTDALLSGNYEVKM